MALRPHREAEPILPDAHAGVEDDPVTEHYVRQAHMGGDRAVPTDAHTLSNHAAGADPRARSDLRLRPDDGAGIDADAIPEPRRRMDQRVRGNAALGEARLRSQRPRVEPRDHSGIGPVWFLANERNRALGNARRELRRDEADAGAGRGERVGVFRVVHVGDLVGLGALKCCRAAHQAPGIGAGRQRHASDLRDLRQRQGRGSFDRVRSGHLGSNCGGGGVGAAREALRRIMVVAARFELATQSPRLPKPAPARFQTSAPRRPPSEPRGLGAP